MASILGALLAFLGALLPVLAVAVPSMTGPRHDPRQVSELPTFVRRVEAAVVGLRVRAADDGPSVATIGRERFASGVIFDRRGFAVPVTAQAEFYEELWRGRAGDVVALSIVRGGAAVQVIAVRSIDRRQLFRTTSR